MFEPYHDEPEYDLAFDFGRLIYGFFAGHFIPPKTLAHQVARLTAIPSMLLGMVVICLVAMSQPSLVVQTVAWAGGLIWFCYTAWAATMVEQTYVKALEKAQREEL